MVRYTSPTGTLFQRLVPVDVDKPLRYVWEECCRNHADFWPLSRRCQKLVQVVGQKLNVSPGAVFEQELKSAGSADTGNRRRRETKNNPLRQLAQAFVQARLDFLKLFGPRRP